MTGDLHGKRENGTGNTPGSQRDRRENEESRPQRMVWGGERAAGGKTQRSKRD